jgi:hypothetical protein
LKRLELLERLEPWTSASKDEVDAAFDHRIYRKAACSSRKDLRSRLVQNLPLPLPSTRLRACFFKEGNALPCANSPFEKGGLRGIFLANGEYNFTKTSIVKFQKLENIITTSMPSNGICSQFGQQCLRSLSSPDIVREVFNVLKEAPIDRAYDFSFAKKADGKLTQAGWKP